MKKKIGFTLAILLLFGKISAQNSLVIKGVVIDAQTQTTLPNVNFINIENENVGGVSNEAGIFEIKITEFPATFRFSFVGYESQDLQITNNAIREFVVELRPTTSPLPQVTVSSKRKIDTVFFEPFSVVDFVFHKKNIVLLAYRNSVQKYILVVLDETTNEPLTELSLTDLPTKGIQQKCTGELFLITASNAYPIKIESENILLGKPIYLNDFEISDLPCVLATEKFLYFSRYFYQGQALKYFGFSRNAPHPTSDSLEKIEFPLIQNEDNIVLLIEETGLRMPWSGDIWEEGIVGKLKTLQESEYNLKGMWKVFYPKLNVPLFTLDSAMVIFNHFESELQYFTPQGQPIKSIPIHYHKNRKWKKQVFFDEKMHRAYTSFNTRWGEKISSIDLKTGTLGEALPIDLAFIEKPKVRNGFIYFLYKNTWAGERNRILHRMKIN